MKKILFMLIGMQSLHGAITTVVNQSEEPVEVLGYGLGCAGVVWGRGLMCGVKPIKILPKQSTKITYRTRQLSTGGGVMIRLANNNFYVKKSPPKALQELPDTIYFPADFVPTTPEAHEVKIHNKTGRDLWAAIYYYNGEVKRATNAIMIPKNTNVNIPRPKLLLLEQRRLLFDTDRAAIKPQMSKEEFKSLQSKNIGLPGDYFIGISGTGQLKGYHYLEWQTRPIVKGIKAIAEEVKPIVKEIAKEALPAVQQNPYKNTEATVRVGNQLHPLEVRFLNVRKPIVKNALEKMLNRPLDDISVPKISFVVSGGGYRAMIAMIGFLVGAEKIGLLDTTTYISTLSGSTWGLGTWLANNTSVQNFKQQFIKLIGGKGLGVIDKEGFTLIADALLTKYIYDQRITSMDLFGVLLANRLLANFGKNRQIMGISEQSKIISTGKFPFPIYTAIDGRRVAMENPAWYEFTPYEVGSTWLSAYVPTWAYGRKFMNGKSTDFAPEQGLGIQFGTFGSAFSVNVKRIWEEAPVVNEILAPIVQQIVSTGGWEKRATFSAAFNFTLGMANSPIKDLKELHFIDAGFDLMLPYPPLSEQRPGRKQDVLIFLNASDNAMNSMSTLKKVEQYTRQHNLKFPQITEGPINAIRVFKDEKDPTVPVVIHMPIVNDPTLRINPLFQEYAKYLENFDTNQCIKGYCASTNFNYSVDQMEQLTALTEFNMVASKDKIIDAINWAIDRKVPGKTKPTIMPQKPQAPVPTKTKGTQATPAA